MDIGTMITLETVQDNDEDVQVFSSKVVDFKGTNIYIHYPISNKTGRTSIVFEGTSFSFKYVGKDDIIYSFQTEVIARKKLNNIPVLVLHFPGDDQVMKIQRRRFLRIKTPLDISVRNEGIEIFPPFTTSSVDISGGGLAIFVPKNIRFPDNSMLSVWIVLPFKSTEYQYVHVTARVIRRIKKQDTPDIVSLEFEKISNKDRDKIIRFCFQKQLEQKKVTNQGLE
ncbi:c-di-GMP-binding flagellar brake protein YcgR [Salirhabdus euzebyi]|uniref:C-di-GMP-binding flagellar brake protein YcgR n=1 Tax=Salirhabdus euzebyi TaxID=394506 RepID=A0A841Q311_9BACI|nr:flagellar brake domain-containing protein [Salirhabdus euzebyi]MBB6452188.1 c-di-GMP-binding flagellar brake protein YcgR [Salirhabdus euzebyi]